MQSIVKKKSGTYYRNLRLFKSMYNSHFGSTAADAPTANENPQSPVLDTISEETLGAFCVLFCLCCLYAYGAF